MGSSIESIYKMAEREVSAKYEKLFNSGQIFLKCSKCGYHMPAFVHKNKQMLKNDFICPDCSDCSMQCICCICGFLTNREDCITIREIQYICSPCKDIVIESLQKPLNKLRHECKKYNHS